MAQPLDDAASCRDTDELRTLLALHAIAMSEMPNGICVIDSEYRIVLFNRKCVEILNLPRRFLHSGLPLRAALERCSDVATLSNATVNEMWRDLKAIFARGKAFQLDRRIRSHAMVTLQFRPIAGGGWICTCERMSAGQQTEHELQTQIERLTHAIENTSHGICLYDAQEQLIVCNDRFRQVFAFEHEAVKPGMTYREILARAIEVGIYTDTTIDDLYHQRIAMFGPEPTGQVVRLSDGRTIEVTVRPIGDEGWVAEYEDVSVRLRSEVALQERNELLDATLEHMAHGLCAYDDNLRVIVVNQRYLTMYGLTADDARPGTPLVELMRRSVAHGIHVPGVTAEDMFADFKQRLIDNKEPVLHRRLADGRIIAVRHQPMANGGWVGTYEDITERQRAEESIAHMARHDALTGLPNRLLLREKMTSGLARVQNCEEFLAVMCLDLDNFKAVNDSLGHPVGDKLLQGVAQLICGTLGENDTIARLGGDEFAILHPVKRTTDVEALARRIIEALFEPIVIDGQEINTGISVGIAIAPENGTTSDQLMKCADLALYRAKTEGRNTYRFFEPDMDAQLQARRTLELDLRRAIAAGEFHLVYQPQIKLMTNELVAMEALVRWTHPERGPIPPANFIPVAEETGLIVPLGEWILRQACAEAARWSDSIRIAVNISPVQFRNRGFVSTVTSALAAAGIQAKRLELEITEAVLMQDDETIVGMLHQLRALGVRIAMDDFGTGYSSLSYLRSFPFDKIKIDRSFITSAGSNSGGGPIIRAIAQLGLSLGIETTAEGIETTEQLQLVCCAGCTEGQGYLIGRPSPVWNAQDFVRLSRRQVAAA